MCVDLGVYAILLNFDLILTPLSSLARANTHRPDEKTAREFNITAGAVLHLVLALRGGR